MYVHQTEVVLHYTAVYTYSVIVPCLLPFLYRNCRMLPQRRFRTKKPVQQFRWDEYVKSSNSILLYLQLYWMFYAADDAILCIVKFIPAVHTYVVIYM